MKEREREKQDYYYIIIREISITLKHTCTQIHKLHCIALLLLLLYSYVVVVILLRLFLTSNLVTLIILLLNMIMMKKENINNICDEYKSKMILTILLYKQISNILII